MSTGEIYELAIIAIILVGIATAAWSGGARNPVATGGLDKRLTKFGRDLSHMKGKVDEIEERVEKVESSAATKEDIQNLEKLLLRRVGDLASALPDIEARQRAFSDKLDEHSRQTSATAATVSHIDRQVGLLVGELIKKGMDK